MNEELCHRNMAFTLYQADEMPQMTLGETKVEKIAEGIYKVWVDIEQQQGHADDPRQGGAEQRRAARPASRSTGKASRSCRPAGCANKLRPGVTQMIDQKDLKRIMLRNGQGNHATRTLQYLVKGAGPITVKYASVKGGTAQKTIALQ